MYSIEEIKNKLYGQCFALDFEVPELELKASPISLDEVLELEDQLGIDISKNTKELIERYDFGEFSVGGIFFGQTGDYLAFIKRFNCEGEIENWWGQGERPKEKLVIAGTDGYMIWQDQSNEKIYAYLRTESPSESIYISKNFELLVRGAGTVHFDRKSSEDKESLAKTISEECNAPEGYKFWHELVLGIS